MINLKGVNRIVKIDLKMVNPSVPVNKLQEEIDDLKRKHEDDVKKLESADHKLDEEKLAVSAFKKFKEINDADIDSLFGSAKEIKDRTENVEKAIKEQDSKIEKIDED